MQVANTLSSLLNGLTLALMATRLRLVIMRQRTMQAGQERDLENVDKEHVDKKYFFETDGFNWGLAEIFADRGRWS